MAVAFQVIEDLRGAGVTISRDGDMIVLDGPEDTMTDELVANLRSLKPQIIAYLRDTAGCWSQENWRYFFDERVTYSQQEIGYDRASAELCGFEDCVDHWLVLNPPRPLPATQCIQCRQSILPQEADVIPVAAGAEIGALHPACSGKWIVSRRWEARRALLWLFARNNGAGT
jgi:hypothetical protein